MATSPKCVCVCVCVYIRVCRCHGATLHDVFVTGVAPAVTGVRRGSAPLPPVACRRPPAPGGAVSGAIGRGFGGGIGRAAGVRLPALARPTRACSGPMPLRFPSSFSLSLSLSLSYCNANLNRIKSDPVATLDPIFLVCFCQSSVAALQCASQKQFKPNQQATKTIGMEENKKRHEQGKQKKNGKQLAGFSRVSTQRDGQRHHPPSPPSSSSSSSPSSTSSSQQVHTHTWTHAVLTYSSFVIGAGRQRRQRCSPASPASRRILASLGHPATKSSQSNSRR